MPSAVQFVPIFCALLLGAAPLSGQITDPAAVPPPVVVETPAGFDGMPVTPGVPVTVRITSPRQEEVTTGPTADIFLQVDNYVLAPGGNRLHVIVDNEAPRIHDNVRKPLVLRGLTEGGHTIRVLAVKPTGLALDDESASAIVYFYVRRKSSFQNYTNPQLPFLTVNLPLNGSTVVGEDGKVWFDFRAENTVLAKQGGHAIRYRINNAESLITDNQPIFWPRLSPGRYELTAELVDSGLQPVSGIFNRVTRTFEVKAAPRALPVKPIPAVPINAAVPAPAHTAPVRAERASPPPQTRPTSEPGFLD